MPETFVGCFEDQSSAKKGLVLVSGSNRFAESRVGSGARSRLLYMLVPENDVADWMGHGSTEVLRQHYHYIFGGAEERGRVAIATMLTPGADDPTERAQVA